MAQPPLSPDEPTGYIGVKVPLSIRDELVAEAASRGVTMSYLLRKKLAIAKIHEAACVHDRKAS